jgi:hypothetical protein
MPSAPERQGDFPKPSMSGKLIPINDPTTGARSPGTLSQSSARTPTAWPHEYPAATHFDNRAISGGNYNYQIQEVQKRPKRSQLLKLDYVPTDKDRFYIRGKDVIASQQGAPQPAGCPGWALPSATASRKTAWVWASTYLQPERSDGNQYRVRQSRSPVPLWQ